MKLMNPVREIRTIKTLLTGAEAEAHEAGEAMPGAEHLLLSALALLAKAPKVSPLLGAHVVTAIARMGHGTAPRALRAMGIDRHALATACRQELEAGRT